MECVGIHPSVQKGHRHSKRSLLVTSVILTQPDIWYIFTEISQVLLTWQYMYKVHCRNILLSLSVDMESQFSALNTILRLF